ncbi:MAG: tetratricopeptide repeat protein [bacterium]
MSHYPRAGRGGRVTAVVLAVLPLVVVGASRAAHAAPARKRVPVETITQEAKAAFKAGEYRKALNGFLRAYARELLPNHSANIALCYEKLELWDQALAYFRRALGEGQGKLPTELLQRLKQKENRILRITSTVRIDVALVGAEVRVDGVRVGTTPLPGPVRLSNGAHKVEVFHLGKLRSKLLFEVGPGHPARITLSVVQERRRPPPERRGQPVPVYVVPKEKPKPKPIESGWALEGGVVGAISTVASAALTIAGIVGGKDCPKNPPEDAPRCNQTGTGLGIAGFLIMASAVPITAAGGGSTRKKARVPGNRALRITGWAGYGLAMASSLAIGVMLWQNKYVEMGWSSGTLVVGVAASLCMTIEAFIAHRQYLRKRTRIDDAPLKASTGWHLRPTLSISRGAYGGAVPVLGLQLFH